ncbi:ImmA/IrrE family metallo-endopeptidase [Clostridium akagii]|uniref:ImmA/IrrE family metallo-endopeptidase n=1 Tax=Clostridium akagii TaxID=91623 RepID=UPI000A73924F|nr:ImmA/IrrE family metallo-endopeptidase [Clostridium akagii]
MINSNKYLEEIILGIFDTYITSDPFEICDCLNIKVIRSNLGNEIKGFFQRTSTNYEIIHIHNKLNYPESKYVCAHELGHAILHTDLSIGFFIENQLQIKNRYEIEADKFAAILLLPNEISFECRYMNLEQLSSYYNVPIQLIKYKYNLDKDYEI